MAGEEILADIRERLHKKSIHEVRLIARAVGVHSPTDGKKDYIIDQIMDIASCKANPTPRSARGAPPKSNDYDKDLVNDIRECVKLIRARRAGDDAPQTLDVSDGGEKMCEGILERDGKYYFLHVNGLLAGAGDVYVAETVINRFGLKRGDKVSGVCRPAANGAALSAITSVNGLNPGAASKRRFEELTPVYPQTRINLGASAEDICARMADMFAPLGLGQRAVISAPSNFSKISFANKIASAVLGSVQAKIIIFLAGGYPEDITYIRRSVPQAEVYSTSISTTEEDNAKAAELLSARCKRLAECGENAVLIVCGLSSLGSAALQVLSAAINAEEGGSLTVIGFVNAAGEYGSENTAGLLNAANMRLVISGGYPAAVNVSQSFTLGREYLQSDGEIKAADALRKAAERDPENVINIFGSVGSNAEIIKNGR